MKQYTKQVINKIMRGCQNDDYTSIVSASRIICKFIEGSADIDCDSEMKDFMKISLWRNFMRAYSRYIKNNPNAILCISIDCIFSSMILGDYAGIEEPTNRHII